MIIVYYGKQDRFKVRRFDFRKNMPTFIPKEYSSEISESGDFKLYEKGSPSYLEGKILLIMPNDIQLFISAIGVFNKIKEGFPTCTISVVCDKGLASLLPKNIECFVSYNPNETKEYYRIYDLSKRNPKVKDKINSLTISIISREQLLLQALDLWESDTDNKYPKTIFNLEKKVGTDKYITLFKNSFSPKPIAEILEKGLGDRFKIELITKIDEKDLAGQIQLLNNSTYNIFTEETPLAILAASLNVPGIIFIPRRASVMDKDYDGFPNFNMAHSTDFASAKDEAIVSKILGFISGKRPSEKMLANQSDSDTVGKKKDDLIDHITNTMSDIELTGKETKNDLLELINDNSREN